MSTPDPDPDTPTEALPALERALARLDRLELYLRSDPHNNALRIDAFETALFCAAWARASEHLATGQSLSHDTLGWQLREGDFWLAQREDDKARTLLERLQRTAPESRLLQDVVAHNLALIDFRQGHAARAIESLSAIMHRAMQPASEPTQTSATAALQTLWLRAHHQAGLVDEACEWVQQREQMGERLAPGAAGVAALIAIDADALPLARRWCAQATAASAALWNIETLVAAGTLALSQRQAAKARQLAEAALARHAKEGRAWSLRAFAQMLEQDLGGALHSFDAAVQHMPDHIGTWIGRGWTQMLAQDLPHARQSFESALALDRNFGESHGGMAVVYALQGEREAAAEHVERAMRLDPRNLSAQLARAVLNGEVADKTSFLRVAQRILENTHLPEGESVASLLKNWPGTV